MFYCRSLDLPSGLQAGSYDGYDYARGVSADADGSFFMAGHTDGSFDGETANVGGEDMVVAKIDGDGSLLWSWQARGFVAKLVCCSRYYLRGISLYAHVYGDYCLP